ncbi:hypothetical protein D3C74_479500 [compost metagenome]
MASAAKAASGVPKPNIAMMNPSCETVPKARISLRSYCLSARKPPISMVAMPMPTVIGAHRLVSAKPGASRAMR